MFSLDMSKMKCVLISWTLIIITANLVSCRLLEHDMILGKQKDIIRLLSKINNDECFEAKPQGSYYLNLGIGFGEIFSITNKDHARDAEKLYDFFNQAVDYNAFYDKAVWARRNVNRGLFVYTFSAFVIMKKHTAGIILPAFYEINPHYFINGDVLELADETKNHTSFDVYVNPGNLQYFTEDVGLNSYYHFINLFSQFWHKDPSFLLGPRNGEVYFYLNQQLLARYNLERYALGLGPIANYDYDHPIESGYKCDLVYPTGEAFPERENNSEIKYGDFYELEMTDDEKANSYTYLKKFEDYLFERVSSQNPLNYNELANIMGVNMNSDNFGKLNLARYMLGNPGNKQQVPSVLEHFETSLRDPMFWSMLKRMIYFYNKASNKRNINVSLYNSIRIEDVVIGKLVTYFDNFEIDITNSKNIKTCDYLDINVRMPRLNHKPFNYTIKFLYRDKRDVLFKIFIGPKYDRKGNIATLRHTRFDFFEIDRFIYKFDPHGKTSSIESNENQHMPSSSFYESREEDYYSTLHFHREPVMQQIVLTKECLTERTIDDNKFFGKDRTGFNKFYKNIIDDFEEGEIYDIKSDFQHYNFPKRLLLPKGSANGTEFRLYVIAQPVTSHGESLMLHEMNDFHYPFNTKIESDSELLGPNTHLQDITIYHEN